MYQTADIVLIIKYNTKKIRALTLIFASPLQSITSPKTPPTTTPYHPPSRPTRPAPLVFCGGCEVCGASGPPALKPVLTGSTDELVCDGSGGKNVADAGVGSASVAERSLKLERASALFAAKTLTVVVVVTVLEVGVLRERAWT